MLHNISVVILFAHFLLSSLSLVAYKEDYPQLIGNNQQTVINIIVPPDGLGGFGDLVSNLFMGEKLLELGYGINIIVDRSFKEKFNILGLLEESNFSSFYLGEHEGIHYFSEHGLAEYIPPEIDDFTIYTSFSVEKLGLSVNKNYKQHNLCQTFKLGKRFILSEYKSLDEKFRHWQGDVVYEIVNTTVLYTGPFLLGMYVSPTPPQRINDKTRILKEYFAIQDDNVLNKFLGFSYSAGPGATNIYLAALAKRACQDPASHYYVLSRFDVHPTIQLPENMTVRTVKHMSFKESKSAICSSDLPILVTGDMSLTLALEYEKNFFYEEFSHKSGLMGDLIALAKTLGKDFPPLFLPTTKSNWEQQEVAYDEYDLTGTENTSFIPKSMQLEYVQRLENGFIWYQENPDAIMRFMEVLRIDISLPNKFHQIIEAKNQVSKYRSLANWNKSNLTDAAKQQVLNIWKEEFASPTKGISSINLLTRLDLERIKYNLVWPNSEAENHFNELLERLNNCEDPQERLDWLLPEIDNFLQSQKPSLDIDINSIDFI